MKHVEIERKWLTDGFPDLPVQKEYFMEQGYLCFAPNTVRIRKTVCEGTVSYILCVKGPGLGEHPEIEAPVSEEQYNALGALLMAPMAKKLQRTYPLAGGEVLECNLVDEGSPGRFYYAEVEFESPQQAKAFVPPDYLRRAREVTGEAGYSMADYCREKGTC